MKRPKKSLGQNYLTDENVIRKIIESFSPEKEDNILEIGPGKGAITTLLIKKSPSLTVVEIDADNCDYLRRKYPELKILNEDFLNLNLLNFAKDKKLRVIGNIPYNITSPIIFRLIEFRKVITDAQLLVQEEVARRLIAKPGSKDYGIPSVLLQTFARVKALFKVSSNCFYPKPRVDSRAVHIDFRISKENEITDTDFFTKVVRAAFSMRRKTLWNSLKGIADLSKTDIDLKRRAETLSPEEFIKLSNSLI